MLGMGIPCGVQEYIVSVTSQSGRYVTVFNRRRYVASVPARSRRRVRSYHKPELVHLLPDLLFIRYTLQHNVRYKVQMY